MSLFDLTPKDDRRSLFGRDTDLRDLARLIDEGRWSVILGPRMVGKTSLAKATAHQSGRPTVYVNLWGARGSEGLLGAFVNGLNAKKSLLRRIQGAVRRVTGVTIAGTGVTLGPVPRPMGAMADLVSILGEEAAKSVIILDEVQELAAISGALLRVLANVFNTHPEVVFLFTGSYFGVLRALLDPPADSPLFGRPPVRIQLEPFERATSVAFLDKGLGEYGLSVDREALGSVVDRSLDGIPGWLTLFGNRLAVQRESLPDAERATVEEAKKVARSEIGHFLEGRPRETYWRALRVLTAPTSWSELRTSLSARQASVVNDNTVRGVLRGLRDAGLISETDHQYRIRDPMVRRYVSETSRAPPSPS